MADLSVESRKGDLGSGDLLLNDANYPNIYATALKYTEWLNTFRDLTGPTIYDIA